MKRSEIWIRFLRSNVLVRLLIILLLTLVSFGTIIHFLEPTHFPTIFEGIWWAVVTISTVGYGDFVPSSGAGRFLGMVLILVGAGFFGFYMATISRYTFDLQDAFTKGKSSFKGEGQMIIVGWNERAKRTIEHFCHKKNPVPIVLIDQTLKENPVPYTSVHFIQGDPTRDEVLLRANIKSASTMLITADQHKTESQADMHSILTLLAAKGLSPNLYCVVELLTTEQSKNAIRAGADEIIETAALTSEVMTNRLANHDMEKMTES